MEATAAAAARRTAASWPGPGAAMYPAPVGGGEFGFVFDYIKQGQIQSLKFLFDNTM